MMCNRINVIRPAVQCQLQYMPGKQQKKTPRRKNCIAVWGNGTVKWMLQEQRAEIMYSNYPAVPGTVRSEVEWTDFRK